MIMQDFWNNKYKTNDYYFGREPNEFFRTFIDSFSPGKILLPGAGEGRNAVYAAEAGWEVDAFDASPDAREKALRFASDKGVDIQYSLQDARDFKARKDYYDVIAVIFLQLPPEERRKFHQELVKSLSPNGGNLYLLAFTKDPLNQQNGVTSDASLLYSPNELLNDLKELQIDMLQKEEVELHEGQGHHGTYRVIKLAGLRRYNKQADDRITL